MTGWLRGAGAFALMVLIGSAGCMQFEESATLFPDGSGKVTKTVAFKKSMITMMEEMAKGFGGGAKVEGPLDQYADPEQLEKSAEGISAWSEPRRTEDGEWVSISFTGYFEDINKVKIYDHQKKPGGEDERKLSFACRFEKTPSGYALIMANEMKEEMKKAAPGGGEPEGGEQGKEMAKAMMEMMKPMLEGMKISFSVTVPGPIQEIAGFMEKKDRTATISLDGKTILASMSDPNGEEAKKMKALDDAKEGRVTWAENTVSEEEMKAFQKEFADAKEKWRKTLEDRRKQSK